MPQNWKTYKLKEIVDQDRGISYGIVQPGKHDPNGIPVIKVNNLTNNSFDLKDLHYVAKSVEKKYLRTRLRGGELLLSLVGSLGRVYQVPDSMRGLNVVRALAVLPVLGEFSPKWVEYWLKSPLAQHLLKQIATTSVQATINLKEAREIKVPFPIKKERDSIASILSAIDDKIELNLQTNKTLEDMAMALYKHYFVDFGPFQNGEFVESELGVIPKGWEVKKLDEVVELILDHRGKTPKKLGGNWSEKSDDCYKAISAKNIKSGKIVKPDTIKFIDKYLYERWMKIPLKDKDILLTSEAPIGEYYFVLNKTDYCLSQRLFGIRSDPYILHPELLYCFLSSRNGQHQLLGRGSGSTVQGIKQSELRKVDIIVPKMEHQEEVSKQLFLYLKRTRNNSEENQTLTQLRDTLLPKLISGEVRVKDIEKNIVEVL